VGRGGRGEVEFTHSGKGKESGGFYVAVEMNVSEQIVNRTRPHSRSMLHGFRLCNELHPGQQGQANPVVFMSR